jgi:hypothetical protein
MHPKGITGEEASLARAQTADLDQPTDIERLV